MPLQIKSEIKISSRPCQLTWDSKNLFVGGEDGTIKSFGSDFSSGVSWQAHDVEIFALAAFNGQVYSASNDGGVKVWSTIGAKIVELPSTGSDIQVIRVYNGKVFAGNEAGHVFVYENNVQKAKFNVLEEVKDLVYLPPYLFTVRHLDLTVTEINPDESATRYTCRLSFEGSAPMCSNGRYLVLMARGGKHLVLHDAIVETNFKRLSDVKASDMIVSSLSMCGDEVWSGGWDGHLKRWEIMDNKLHISGDIDLGSSINSLVATHPGCVYVGLSKGKLVNVINKNIAKQT